MNISTSPSKIGVRILSVYYPTEARYQQKNPIEPKKQEHRTALVTVTERVIPNR